MVTGDMVMVHQRVARCVEIDNGWCLFAHIDLDGFVRTISAPASAATPMRTIMDPRSRWPEAGHLDEVIAEREEREAAAIKKAERKAEKKVSRKARRSNKIKRKDSA